MQQKRSNPKRIAKRIEYKVAKLLHGKRIPLSGASWMKGDVITDEYLIEVKARTYRGKRIWIDPKWIKQICEEAKIMNRKPLLVVYNRSSRHYWVIEILDEPCQEERHSFGLFETELCLEGRKCKVYLLK